MFFDPFTLRSKVTCFLAVLFLLTCLHTDYIFAAEKKKTIKKSGCEFHILSDIPISTNTGEKPQSKLWTFANTWWAVLPDADGTFIWRLDSLTWKKTLKISEVSNSHADVKNVGNVTHILLFSGENSELVSVEYNKGIKAYQLWTRRPNTSVLNLAPVTETATIDIDASDRMWLAFDTASEAQVIWSDPPYTTWSAPVTIASGIKKDDICVITAMPDNKVAVLWSNQNTKRFGFRVHNAGDDSALWSKDEQPASQSAIDTVGDGMADDHMNIAVAADGTLYAAVKTSYDTPGYPLVALLVRRPNGTWDDLYYLDDKGTRGIVCLDEQNDKLTVYYSHKKIYKRESGLDPISFGPRIEMVDRKLNNVTSTKQNYTGELVILGSDSHYAKGILIE